MAYMKYKELGKEYNFNQIIPVDKAPSFIRQYIESDEEIYGIYGTDKEACVFSSKKLILFDSGFFTESQKVHFFPYKKISSSAIEFKSKTVNIYFSYDSGYQSDIRFVDFNKDDQANLKKVYLKLISKICEK